MPDPIAALLRATPEGPILVACSGGLDSSTVVALMAQASSAPVRTFSIGFAESDFDELAYARQVAARYGTEHYELIVKPRALDVLPKLAPEVMARIDDAVSRELSQVAASQVKMIGPISSRPWWNWTGASAWAAWSMVAVSRARVAQVGGASAGPAGPSRRMMAWKWTTPRRWYSATLA